MTVPKPYRYSSPTNKGLRQVYIPAKEHNKMFKNEQVNWRYRYEYYMGENEIEMHRFNTFWVKLLMIILFPVSIFWAGISNFKELVIETKRELNQKKYGSFSSITVYRRNFEGFEQFKRIAHRWVMLHQ